MSKLTERSDIRLLAILSWVVYFASYVTRINYGAVLVEFVAAEGVDNAAASLITSVLFVTYGAGQLLSGYLGDRVSPRMLIFGGLAVAVGCNLLMPVCAPHIPVMAAVWGVNGLAQAMMWPPLVKILTSALSKEEYARMVPTVSTSCACATIAVYLVSPLLITLSGWKTVFAVSSVVGLLAAVVWLLASRNLLRNVDFTPVDRHSKTGQTQVSADGTVGVLWKLLPVILMGIAVQGMLRDGISTWMPTMMTEAFHMKRTVSILTGVALPTIHMVVSLCTYGILRRMHHNVMGCMALFFAVATGLLLALAGFGMGSAVTSVILIALVNGTAHGINALQVSYLPACFTGYGRVSFLAGLLNSATYVGSALSTWLFAVISERLGWGATVNVWVLLAAFGTGLTVFCVAVLNRNKKAGAIDNN